MVFAATGVVTVGLFFLFDATIATVIDTVVSARTIGMLLYAFCGSAR